MSKIVAHNRALDADLEVIGCYRQSGRDCLVYADAIPALARMLKRRIKDCHQNVVAVTGGTGSGKSTFAIRLCKEFDPKWELKPNYIYSVGDLRAKLDNPDASPISLFDEGTVSLNSANATRADDKKMVVLFDTMRSLGWTTVICVPSITMLNRRVRDYHVDYMCLCPGHELIRGYDKRGFVQIYEHVYRDWGDPYWRLIATTVFDVLPPRIRREYEGIKLAHQRKLIDKFVTDEEAVV